MKPAYSHIDLYNLWLIKKASTWREQDIISKDQWKKIREEFVSKLYHPNWIIRILLFLASLIALSGVTGILALIFVDSLGSAVSILSILYGIGSWVILEMFFIKANHHYKSGVNEAVLYHSLGFVIGGIGWLIDYETTGMWLISAVLCAVAAVRYLDLITTLTALICLTGGCFSLFYEMGGVFVSIIPIFLGFLFLIVYLAAVHLTKIPQVDWWKDNLVLTQYFSLIMIYLSLNYLVVRELSIELMGMSLSPEGDIPLAYLFYLTTIAIPVVYLYLGIRRKDLVLIRVSILVLAVAVFTYKYYFSTLPIEVGITISGGLMIILSIALINYLRVVRHGFTRENTGSESWMAVQGEALLVAQTMGGNVVEQPQDSDSGGKFGGGGASGSF